MAPTRLALCLSGLDTLGLLVALRHLTPGLPLYLDSKASAFAVNDTLCRGSESEASGALG